MPIREGAVVKWFNQRPKENKKEAEQEERPLAKKLWGVDFNIVGSGLDETQVVRFVNEMVRQFEASTPASVRSILKSAIAEAEKVAAAVKVRATVEAQEEAARIIAEANEKASAQKKAQTEGAAVTENSGSATSVEGLLSAIGAEKADREIDYSQIKIDGQMPFVGEVELAIGVPVDLKMVSALYSTLQTIPELRILTTRGSASSGTVITVVLNKPLPLPNLISAKMPNIELVAEAPEKEGGRSGLLGQGKKFPTKRIKLVQKA